MKDLVIRLFEGENIRAEDPKKARELLDSALVSAGFKRRHDTYILGTSQLQVSIEDVD